MLTRGVEFCLLLLLAFSVSACASAKPTPRIVYITTTPAPKSPTPRAAVATATLPVSSPAAPRSTEAPLPTLLPTTTVPAPLATATPTVPAATKPKATARPSPTASPQAPPGVYVTGLRVDPPVPYRGAPVTFLVTFENTTGQPQLYNWLVLIYRPDQKNSFGETATLRGLIPDGTSVLPSANNWGIGSKGDCEPYSAQVNWQEADKIRTPFTSTDGKIVTLNFQVCP